MRIQCRESITYKQNQVLGNISISYWIKVAVPWKVQVTLNDNLMNIGIREINQCLSAWGFFDIGLPCSVEFCTVIIKYIMIKPSIFNTCSNLSTVKYTYLHVQNEFHLYNHYMNFASFYIKIVKINISEICNRKKWQIWSFVCIFWQK